MFVVVALCHKKICYLVLSLLELRNSKRHVFVCHASIVTRFFHLFGSSFAELVSLKATDYIVVEVSIHASIVAAFFEG